MRRAFFLALLILPFFSPGCATEFDPLVTVRSNYSWTADRTDSQIVAAAGETITTAQAE